MAEGFTGPPQVNFYAMLNGLGDTIQNNAQVNRQQQQLRRRPDRKRQLVRCPFSNGL